MATYATFLQEFFGALSVDFFSETNLIEYSNSRKQQLFSQKLMQTQGGSSNVLLYFFRLLYIYIYISFLLAVTTSTDMQKYVFLRTVQYT